MFSKHVLNRILQVTLWVHSNYMYVFDIFLQDVPAEGAVGGGGARANLQQGVGALMDDMRDLLHNIRPVDAPVKNEEGDPEGEGNEEGEWD